MIRFLRRNNMKTKDIGTALLMLVLALIAFGITEIVGMFK